jgi:hypothetical protein
VIGCAGDSLKQNKGAGEVWSGAGRIQGGLKYAEWAWEAGRTPADRPSRKLSRTTWPSPPSARVQLGRVWLSRESESLKILKMGQGCSGFATAAPVHAGPGRRPRGRRRISARQSMLPPQPGPTRKARFYCTLGQRALRAFRQHAGPLAGVCVRGRRRNSAAPESCCSVGTGGCWAAPATTRVAGRDPSSPAARCGPDDVVDAEDHLCCLHRAGDDLVLDAEGLEDTKVRHVARSTADHVHACVCRVRRPAVLLKAQTGEGKGRGGQGGRRGRAAQGHRHSRQGQGGCCCRRAHTERVSNQTHRAQRRDYVRAVEACVVADGGGQRTQRARKRLHCQTALACRVASRCVGVGL